MKNKNSYRNIGQNISQNISKYGSYSLLIVFAMNLLLSAGKAAMVSSDSAIVLNTTLDMFCFPPTSPENTPPCPVPVGHFV